LAVFGLFGPRRGREPETGSGTVPGGSAGPCPGPVGGFEVYRGHFKAQAPGRRPRGSVTAAWNGALGPPHRRPPGGSPWTPALRAGRTPVREGFYINPSRRGPAVLGAGPQRASGRAALERDSTRTLPIPRVLARGHSLKVLLSRSRTMVPEPVGRDRNPSGCTPGLDSQGPPPRGTGSRTPPGCGAPPGTAGGRREGLM